MSQSRKHPPRVDEYLERQVEGHLQGAPPGGRAEEWREPDPPVDGEPEISTVPDGDTQARADVPLHLTPDEIEDRSRFGRYLPRGIFPADRDEIIQAARDADAPDDVVEELRQLPAGETFETPARAWASLSHKIDRRF